MFITEKNVKVKAVRASGPGGQNIGRRSTKVQAWVKISDLPIGDKEKKIIRKKLWRHINHNDELEAVCDEERSQRINREKVLEHLNQMIEEALRVPAKRIPTEPPRSAENFRIKEKKILSEKKRSRRVNR
jgi:ribosome-associated protein